MSTYVIGDIHGCYSQFIELKDRIERKDINSIFILIGDVVARGQEDEKMLAWIYENISLDGKYQMVLGNHDDNFIEIFGEGKFDTIYSLGIKSNNNARPSDEFNHLYNNKSLMYKYAEFLAKQQLIKRVEINEIIIYALRYNYEEIILQYKVYTTNFYYDDMNKIMDNNIKMDKNERRYFLNEEKSKIDYPTGLVTCDFYDNEELFTVKILKNLGSHILIKVTDSKNNILCEINRSY